MRSNTVIISGHAALIVAGMYGPDASAKPMATRAWRSAVSRWRRNRLHEVARGNIVSPGLAFQFLIVDGFSCVSLSTGALLPDVDRIIVSGHASVRGESATTRKANARSLL